MPFAEYGHYDALGLAELVRRGEVSPSELLDEALARTALVNPKINAVIHLMEARAREAIAATAESSERAVALDCAATYTATGSKPTPSTVPTTRPKSLPDPRMRYPSVQLVGLHARECAGAKA